MENVDNSGFNSQNSIKTVKFSTLQCILFRFKNNNIQNQLSDSLVKLANCGEIDCDVL